MGRLFWKFFAFIALAQLGGIIAIGTLFWLTPPRDDGGPPPPPPQERLLHGAGPPPHGPHHGSPLRPPIAPTIATLLASLGTAALLAWYVAKPIRGLRQAFAAASGGRLDHRVAPSMGTRQDELADLGREFDRGRRLSSRRPWSDTRRRWQEGVAPGLLGVPPPSGGRVSPVTARGHHRSNRGGDRADRPADRRIVEAVEARGGRARGGCSGC